MAEDQAAFRRIHIALGVEDVARSVDDYSERLGRPPVVNVPGEYALWRSREVNLSIRRNTGPACLRHLGWEESSAPEFGSDVDVNGIVWEHFSAEQQDAEIRRHWPAEE
jgi:catechol 2,3-dioxygenase-like lactoylglutathione lyase family enzyme